MGKDKNGKFIPPKGKPSGEGKSKAGLKDVYNIENLDETNKIEDNYTDGADEPLENVKITKPNRNPNKENDKTGPPYS